MPRKPTPRPSVDVKKLRFYRYAVVLHLPDGGEVCREVFALSSRRDLRGAVREAITTARRTAMERAVVGDVAHGDAALLRASLEELAARSAVTHAEEVSPTALLEALAGRCPKEADQFLGACETVLVRYFRDILPDADSIHAFARELLERAGDAISRPKSSRRKAG